MQWEGRGKSFLWDSMGLSIISIRPGCMVGEKGHSKLPISIPISGKLSVVTKITYTILPFLDLQFTIPISVIASSCPYMYIKHNSILANAVFFL